MISLFFSASRIEWEEIALSLGKDYRLSGSDVPVFLAEGAEGNMSIFYVKIETQAVKKR